MNSQENVKIEYMSLYYSFKVQKIKGTSYFKRFWFWFINRKT